MLRRRHVEFFPHKFHMTRSQVRRIRREILCYLGGKSYITATTTRITERTTEATTLNQSTAATIFWTLDQMKQVDAQLASVGMCPKSCPAELRDDREAEALAENEIIEDTGVVLCCM